MKKILLFLFTSVAVTLVAQTSNKDITIRINHLIGSEALSFNNIFTTSSTFNVSRMSYYISEIKITHNGGQVLSLPNQYLLVHGDISDYSLGVQNIGNIESIDFSIGVDQTANHADPSTYSTGHPLAHQSPSMHWGWAAGYRFLAMEGDIDDSGDGIPNTAYQYHAVGDDLRQRLIIPVANSTETVNNDVVIHLEADYNKLFTGIAMGGIYHGGGSIINTLMSNFYNENVFSAGTLTSVDPLTIWDDYLAVGPNPADDRMSINYYFEKKAPVTLVVTSIYGQKVMELNALPNTFRMELDTKPLISGSYILGFYQGDTLLKSAKVLIIH